MPNTPDVVYMKRAIRLARKGRGKTSPNPMVGAVLVREGRVVGEGYHAAAGKDHAEISALAEASKESIGATLYTNLEPCCHEGKRTPPCTEAIIRGRIQRVVSAMKDPNPLVFGKGFKILKRAGIEISEGLLLQEAQRLNEAFIKHTHTGLPYVVLKAAMTLDGRIAAASGESRWISGPKARREVDRLRADADGVMIGIGTVLADNPALCLREIKGRNPLRIVIDPLLKIPMRSHLVTSVAVAPTLVFTTIRAASTKIAALKKSGVQIEVLSSSKGLISFEALLNDLGKRGIVRLLIEGGGKLNGIALRSNLVDRVIFYISPRFLCGEDAIAVVRGKALGGLDSALTLDQVDVRRLGDDIRIEGEVRKWASVER